MIHDWTDELLEAVGPFSWVYNHTSGLLVAYWEGRRIAGSEPLTHETACKRARHEASLIAESLVRRTAAELTAAAEMAVAAAPIRRRRVES